MGNKKLKVLLVSPYSVKKVGGIGTWTKAILDYQANVDDVELLYQTTSNGLKLKKVVNSNKILRIFVGIIDSCIILANLYISVKKNKPDVVHYTSSASLALCKDKIAIFIVKKIGGAKFVIHWHFGRIPQLCNSQNKEYKRLMEIIKKSDYSIVIDKNSYNSLKDEDINNIAYIPNPVTSYIQYKSENLILNFDRIRCGTVLFVGHIIVNKGVFELVQACSQVQNVKKLILVGPYEEPIKEKLLNIAKECNKGNWLEFKGVVSRENVMKFYEECSIFCLPSYTEGFPFVILESMALSCPIIATKVGAIPEMLDGNCGLLVDIKDVEQLKNAIMKMFENPQLSIKMGLNARKKVLNQYTISNLYKEYIKVWRNAVK